MSGLMEATLEGITGDTARLFKAAASRTDAAATIKKLARQRVANERKLVTSSPAPARVSSDVDRPLDARRVLTHIVLERSRLAADMVMVLRRSRSGWSSPAEGDISMVAAEHPLASAPSGGSTRDIVQPDRIGPTIGSAPQGLAWEPASPDSRATKRDYNYFADLRQAVAELRPHKHSSTGRP